MSTWFDSNQHVPLLRALLGLDGGLGFKEKDIIISSQPGTEELIRLHGAGVGVGVSASLLLTCLLFKGLNTSFVYCRELATGTVSLTGD